jgi:hypothetical protein
LLRRRLPLPVRRIGQHAAGPSGEGDGTRSPNQAPQRAGRSGEGVRFKGFAPVHGGCRLRLQLLAGLYALTPLGNVISNTGSRAMRSCHRDPLWQEGSVRSSVDAMSDEGRVRAGVVESPLHLHCPRCGLAMSARSRWIAAKHCPRCVARAHKLVVLLTDSAEADRLIRGVAVDEAQRTRGTR